MAGAGQKSKGQKTKLASTVEVAREDDKGIRTPLSLPLASRQFVATRTEAAPHALDLPIAATFPDISTATLTGSNYLLPESFIAIVADPGPVSHTGTNTNPSAEVYPLLFPCSYPPP